MNYSMMLPLAFPGAEWALYDSHDFGSLVWGPNNTIPQPSHADLLAAFELVKPQEAMRLLRLKRNELLQQSDVFVFPDFPHKDEATKQAWLAYRQALRDLPSISSPQLLLPSLELDESSVAWPAKPISS